MSNQHRKRTRQIIKRYEAKSLRRRSLGVRLADKFTSYFGGLGFLIVNFAIFIAWIFINVGLVPGVSIFDRFPFILLITAVSLEAIILTIIVLMSQNRQNAVSSMREELSLQVELIAEKEISKVLVLMGKLLEKEGIKVKDPELKEMLKAVDTSYIEKKLEEQLEGKK